MAALSLDCSDRNAKTVALSVLLVHLSVSQPTAMLFAKSKAVETGLSML